MSEVYDIKALRQQVTAANLERDAKEEMLVSMEGLLKESRAECARLRDALIVARRVLVESTSYMTFESGIDQMYRTVEQCDAALSGADGEPQP